ncbi:MAG: efflux RND transporter periplasmic adaptor subunit [Caldilineaceae bacterium]
MPQSPVPSRRYGPGAARWLAVLLVVLAALAAQGCSVQLPWQAEAEPTPVLPVYQPSSEGQPIQSASQPAQSQATQTQTTQPQAVVAAEPVAAPRRSASYNGEIVPVRQVVVIGEVAGRVLELNVDVGDVVTAGQLLLRVDSSILEAQREQALAGLIAAQSQLDLLQADPEAADLAAAQAGVNAAGASYQRAVGGATDEDLTMALAQVRQAEAAVNVAQAAYNQVKGNPNIGMLPQSMQLQQATIGLEAARAQYEKVAKGATGDVVAGAYAQLSNARAQLERLERGPKAAQIRAAEAQVKQAETGLYLTQLQLDKATVKSPLDGVVAQVQTSAGSMAGPGTPLIVLLSHDVKVLIPVEENQVATLALGNPATIQVNAWPDRTFAGVITNIAPNLDPATRTVQVTVRPVGDAPELQPGMSVSVTLGE